MIPVIAIYKEGKKILGDLRLTAINLAHRARTRFGRNKQQPLEQPHSLRLPSLSGIKLFFAVALFIATIIVMVLVLWPLILLTAAIAMFALYRTIR
jgi:hypothetical protein